jgi:AcrR family transcriptional regulator
MTNKKSKGELTTERILDAAEKLFADKGYEGSKLRDIAAGAGIREPGVYNYFGSKQLLYAAVLDRALAPLSEVLEFHFSDEQNVRAYATLPQVITDLLLQHPRMAALFQQALQGDLDSVGNQLVKSWLDKLLLKGNELMATMGSAPIDRADIAIQSIAMFNLCTGYFLAQRAFETLAEGQLTDPDNIERQKQLLARVSRALMPGQQKR